MIIRNPSVNPQDGDEVSVDRYPFDGLVLKVVTRHPESVDYVAHGRRLVQTMGLDQWATLTRTATVLKRNGGQQ